jgi:hypothetical protein
LRNPDPTTLRLHDPRRKPLDWPAHLSASQFAVFLTHVKLRYELSTDGTPKPRSIPSYCLVFNSLIEAEAFCLDFVNAFPNARCDIYEHLGKSRPPLASFTHPSHAAAVPNRRSAHRMLLLAAMLVIPSPFLFWIDWRVRGRLIVPTLIGLTLITAALRLTLWALGTLQAVQSRAERNR